MTHSKSTIQHSTFPRYERYKDSGVEWLGEVPEHWELRSLRGILKERGETNEGTKTDFILSVMKDRGVIPYTEKGNVGNKMSEDITTYKIVQPGDLVINKMNAIIGSLGISRYHGALSKVYFVMQPRYDYVDNRFYGYLFQIRDFQKSLSKISYGIMELRESINFNEFKNLPLPLPPKPEQDRIVAFLDRKTAEIDALIAKKQRQIELLDEQKAILIHRAVTRGLNPNAKLKPSGIEWIGEIPEHWEVKRISHLGLVGNGSTPARSNPRYWNSADYPWLNSGSVNQGIITKADQFVSNLALKECHLPLVKPGSIVIAITGQGKTRGTAALLTIPATINQHLAYIEIQTPVALPEFVHLALTAQYRQLRAISESGSTKGALTCQDVKEFKIVLPPRDEQKSIVLAVERRQTDLAVVASKFESQIESLQTLRSILIADAVTGNIKVT